MRFPFYRQADAMDCGPTCLRMVAKYHGKSIAIQTLRDKTEIGKAGVNLLGISDAAESIGFRGHAVKLTYESLAQDAELPAIVHWDQHHFVVVYRIKKGLVEVADPGRGLVTLTEAEFRSHWISDRVGGHGEGIALFLEPSPALYAYEDDHAAGLGFGNIFNYLLPHRALLGQLLLGLGLGSLIQLCLPFLTQSVVDTGVNTGNLHFIYIVLLAQVALFVGRTTVEFVRGWILLHVSTRINISILSDFLIKLMRLPVSFFDSKQTGDILQRMNDHSRIESFLTGSSLNVLFSVLNLIVFSVVLAVYNLSIFTVFCLASLLYAGWVFAFLKPRRTLDYKRFAVSAKEQSVTIQLVQGMQEIKLHGAERPTRAVWEGLQAKSFGLSMRALTLDQWQQSGASFINEGKNIFITFLSAKAVIDGSMTLGAMLAVQYIIGQLNSPIMQMIGFMQGMQTAKISMDRLNEVHTMDDEEPTHLQLQRVLPLAFQRHIAGGIAPLPSAGEGVSGLIAPPSPGADERSGMTVARMTPDGMVFSRDMVPSLGHTPAIGDPTIRFEKVSFTYPGAGNEPVLRDISLDIPIGKTTAIVGGSGSGKTTLLKLLLKFYDPQSGEIRLDGLPLRTVSPKAWRARCGVVMQDSFIFSDTIARNIAVGQPRVDMHRLRYAADVANVREFIESLPLGFNTQIGTEGTGVSMGQRQRILIARAVYRDPDVILFDEATNSLDANNESVILRNLESFFANRTVIVVAHRLSTVKGADQIVVLNRGIITEQGGHQELQQARGEYYQLVKNQLELGA